MVDLDCSLTPKVKDKEGKDIDSKLFEGLLSFTKDRKQTVKIYLATKNQDFIAKLYNKLKLDEYGEPTLGSLLQHTDLAQVIGAEKVLEKLNRDIGFYKKGEPRPALWVNNEKNYRELCKKCLDFNKNSEYKDAYIADVVKIQDSETGDIRIGVRVFPKTDKLHNINAVKLEYNYNLNTRLRELLTSWGIAVGKLEALEDREKINGVTDFDTAKTTAEGLIEMIRLAEGERGEKTLPEEFAHFALEALGDHPLSTRLINSLINNNLVSEILGEDYEEYKALYNDNEVLLAKEAAGKLLAKHLLGTESIPAAPYKTLLQRVIDAIKSLFKGFNPSSIRNAMAEANEGFDFLAKEILAGKLNDQISVKNINSKTKLFQVETQVNKHKELLEKIINNEIKRLQIYGKRNPSTRFTSSQELLINKLESSIILKTEVLGIETFISEALTTLQKLQDRLANISDEMSLNEKAGVLRDVKNYIASYADLLDDIDNEVLKDSKEEEQEFKEAARLSLEQTFTLMRQLKRDYDTVSRDLFVQFLKPFMGQSLVVPFGKNKGRQMTVEQLVKEAEDDISFFDRWLNSMAESSDDILKVMDQAVKKSKERGRLKTIDAKKILEEAEMKLNAAGIKTTSWMFKRDADGNLTGKYIQELDFDLYKRKYDEKMRELTSLYVNDYAKYSVAKQQWLEENTEIVDGIRKPKYSLYADKDFMALSNAQKEYYNTIMTLKEQMDAKIYLGAQNLHNIIKIRKDLIGRLKGSKSIKDVGLQLVENIKDNFVRRSDDIDIENKAALEDFEGNEVQTLPIYYTTLRDGESMNDMSEDVTATMLAYAAMANDYEEMNEVVNVLELGRDILKQRHITQTSGDKPLKEVIKQSGKKIENILFKTGDKSYFMQRLDDFFSMQVYNRYMKDEGTFGNSDIDKGKVANFVNRLTALNSYALNLLSGISNIATGSVMMRIEAVAGQFFNYKDVIKGDKNYWAAMPLYLAEIGSKVKTNKLALFDEMFNVMQEYEQNVQEANYNRKTWFGRMFGESALFFMNNMGEHWMQNRTALALANSYTMKDKSGNRVSLWDALEVVPNPNNKKYGATLKIKDEYTKEDGTEFTQEDIIAFSRKSAAINQGMHGIYNKLDRNAFQKLGVGRMAMMFRKWIVPSLNKRFKGASYNYDLQSWQEGYYRTTWKFLGQMVKELKEGKFALIANFKNLSETEKANIIRATTEVSHLVALTLVLGLIDWPDNKDRSQLSAMAEYQLRRLYSEIGVLVPGPQMIGEALRIAKSPAAGINTMESLLNLIKLMNPYNYEEFLGVETGGKDAILKSGRFKGRNRATKYFYESPLAPMYKTVQRGLHPEEAIPFFKQ